MTASDVCIVSVFRGKFLFSKKNAISLFLTPAETKLSVLISASVERFGVSHMPEFFNYFLTRQRFLLYEKNSLKNCLNVIKTSL